MADQQTAPPVPVLPAVFTDADESAAMARELLDEVVAELAFEHRFADFAGVVSTQRPVIRSTADVAVCEGGGVVIRGTPTVILPVETMGIHAVVDARNMLTWSPTRRAQLVAGAAEGLAQVLWDKLTEMLQLARARPAVEAAEALIVEAMGEGPRRVGVLANGIEVVYDERALALALLPKSEVKAWLEEGEEEPGWHMKLRLSFAAGLVTTGACRLYAVGPGPISS